MRLIDCLNTVLKDIPVSGCVESELWKAYNQNSSCTKLMLGGLEASAGEIGHNGLIVSAAMKKFPKAVHEFSKHRYIDLAVYSGNWWTGEKFCRLAVEVENDWRELKGTLRDLMAFQSLQKWAVFYHPNLDAPQPSNDPKPESRIDELKKIVIEVVDSLTDRFKEDGFQESAGTEYEIVVLPTKPGTSGLVDASALETVFTFGGDKIEQRVRKLGCD